MRRSLLASPLLAATLCLAAHASRAERLRFTVDPVRSTLSVGAATGLTFSAGGGLFGIGSQVIPAQAPATGAGATLPNGMQSNGLTTSVEGFLVVDLDAGPSSIRFVPGASRLGLGTSGSWLPGPPLAPTTPTDGDLAFKFYDATFVWGTDLVLRDALLAFESASASPLAAAGAGHWTFAAGCASGCPAFRLSQALLDVKADRLGTARTGLRHPPLVPSAPGTQGQLASLGGGRFEATIPVSLTLTLGAAELGDPLTQSLDVSLTGQIVAVPEPGASLQMLAVLAVLAVLSVRSVRRRGAPASERRREIALGLVLAGFIEVGGCPGALGPAPPPDDAQVDESCDSQDLNVTKNGGSPVSDPSPSPDCNPDNFTGFIGEGGQLRNFTLSTDAFLLANGLRGNGRCGVTVDLTGATAPNTMELDQRCFQRLLIAPFVGGPTTLYFIAVRLGLGAAANEALPTGSVTVTPPGGAPVTVPLDGTDVPVVVSNAGGTVNIAIVSTSTRTLGGKGFQGVFLEWSFFPGACSDNYQCLTSDPLRPFCGGGLCHDGGLDEPCDDASSCDYEGQGMLCDEVSGTCQAEADVLGQQ